MTKKTCINARMIANEKDVTNRWVYLALYHHLWMDVGDVRLDEGSLNQLLTLVQRVQLLLSESWTNFNKQFGKKCLFG